MQQDIAVMLLYVLESKGSSPGRQGFMMAVNATNEINGSIGGGIMEHKLVEMAKQKLLSKQSMHSLHLQVHDKTAANNQSGMICSGEQTIFIYSIQQKDIEHIKALITSLENFKKATLQLTPAGIQFLQTVPDQNFFFKKISEEDFIFLEKTGFQNRLFIVGGGHCSVALSQLMCNMDFYIEVFDDRNDLNTMQQNEYAHKQYVVDDYEKLGSMIPSGNNHYVVIMTVGYRTDSIALRSLIKNSFVYLGMLGSKSKIKKLLSDLLKEGIDTAVLKNIHAPIGIPIKSQTTEEIAVSITAEIIKVKNQKL